MSILIKLILSLVSIVIVTVFKVATRCRLTVPLCYMIIVNAFFNDWYLSNAQFTQIILGAIIVAVLISWLISIYQWIKNRNIQRRRDELDLIISSRPMNVYKIKKNANEKDLILLRKH